MWPWPVASNLCEVAEDLWEAPEPYRPEVMTAMARLGRNDLSGRVACANVAVAAAILVQKVPVGLGAGAQLDPLE